MLGNLQAAGSVVVRDHYQYWSSKAEDSFAGKLHLVDRSDETVNRIFFDDNVSPNLQQWQCAAGAICETCLVLSPFWRAFCHSALCKRAFGANGVMPFTTVSRSG